MQKKSASENLSEAFCRGDKTPLRGVQRWSNIVHMDKKPGAGAISESLSEAFRLARFLTKWDLYISISWHACFSIPKEMHCSHT